MKTLSAIYKGKRTVELTEDPALSEDTPVLVVIPEKGDESELRTQLKIHSEATFSRLWEGEEDDVWNEYL